MKQKLLDISRPHITVYLSEEEAKILDNHPSLKDALVEELSSVVKKFIKENK